MKQFKMYIDLHKEEEYLNQMVNKGWVFKKRSMFSRYHFEKSTQQICYKVDYRLFKNKSDFNGYVALFEDAGFQHISGVYYSGHQYFASTSQETSQEIFSDKESKTQRYKRLQRNCVSQLLCLILYMIGVYISVDLNLSNLFFLTPGLWEMEGVKFWTSFWFEFPFMLLRVLPVLFFAIAFVLNGIWAIKAKRLYENLISQEENKKL